MLNKLNPLQAEAQITSASLKVLTVFNDATTTLVSLSAEPNLHREHRALVAELGQALTLLEAAKARCATLHASTTQEVKS